MNHHLAEFVFQEDDENTLMIIYYAGHGTPDYVTQQLFFSRQVYRNILYAPRADG